jgi:hypothetical protein
LWQIRKPGNFTIVILLARFNSLPSATERFELVRAQRGFRMRARHLCRSELCGAEICRGEFDMPE